MTKKIFSFIVAALLLSVGTACEKEKVISRNDLPKASLEFLAKHFPNLKVTFAAKDWDNYEVLLENGFEVNFRRNGEWDEVDGNRDAVPQSIVDLLPKTIADYVATQFPNTRIVSVNREWFGYDIDLSNELDLKFDTKGNIREIDN
ncbi:MAG: PepSY-like domain-containing protein [Bacteroidales bacterium]|jgi:hypothetical protein|nr:PepSY-like domain-containing protein [Bacteroidales bacterium]